MIKSTVKHLTGNRYKIRVEVSGEHDAVVKAELLAIYKEFIKTERGTAIINEVLYDINCLQEEEHD